MMRVLVTGGRDYCGEGTLRYELDEINRSRGISLLIEGGASGADEIAGKWAADRGVPFVVIVADWKRHGLKAGPIRNQRMIDEERPDLVLAAPGGRGTADMVRRARSAGIPVKEVR